MATTWAATDTTSVKATCTTGTESAPTEATEGISMAGLGAFNIHVEAAATLTAASTLLCYILNSASGEWNPAPALNITLTGGANSEATAGYEIAPSNDRIAYVPSGVGVACTIYVNGTRRV